MNTIYISTGDGQSTPYDETQVRAMYQQGLLQNNAVYWKEGMSDWQPLAHLFPPPISSKHMGSPISQEAIMSDYTFTKNPLNLTQTLKIFLWILLSVRILSMLIDFAQLSLLQNGIMTPDALDANEIRQTIISFIFIGIYIPTGIIFLKWIYRANLNCRGFGATDMKFTPGWAIGYYFIPLINLVRPYQAMKEIWNVSRDPKNWKDQKGNDILSAWWGLWLITGFLGNTSMRLSLQADNPSTWKTATIVSIASSFAFIPLTIVAVIMISRIIDMQVKLTQNNS